MDIVPWFATFYELFWVGASQFAHIVSRFFIDSVVFIIKSLQIQARQNRVNIHSP